MSDWKKYRLAGFERRFLAKFIDGLIAFSPIFLLVVLGKDSGWRALLGLSVGAAYFLFADSMGGRSLGKRTLGLKVVDYRYGTPCTPLQSLTRNAAGFSMLRVLQEFEEEDEREKKRFLGTLVIDLSQPFEPAKEPTGENSESGQNMPADLDLKGIMDVVRGEGEGDGEK